MSAGSTDPIAVIRGLYFKATPATILRDFDRAIDLLKSVQDPSERERASVYMEGLAALRQELTQKGRRPPGRRRRP
jgi:hypothetical protein